MANTKTEVWKAFNEYLNTKSGMTIERTYNPTLRLKEISENLDNPALHAFTSPGSVETEYISSPSRFQDDIEIFLVFAAPVTNDNLSTIDDYITQVTAIVENIQSYQSSNPVYTVTDAGFLDGETYLSDLLFTDSIFVSVVVFNLRAYRNE